MFMTRAALIFIALVLLVACNSTPVPTSKAAPPQPSASSGPSATSSDAPTTTASEGNVSTALQGLAGKEATNCGDIKTLAGEEVSKAGDCAMNSAKNKKAFLVSYEMPGLSVGVAGNADGKLFMAQSSEVAGKATTKSQPCPAELRIAQSGRVTCMPAGSMGVAPGSDNPHAGGMPAVPGTSNPHAGGMPTAAGAPNPHASSPTKSH